MATEEATALRFDNLSSVQDLDSVNMSSFVRNPCFNCCCVTFNVNVGSNCWLNFTVSSVYS